MGGALLLIADGTKYTPTIPFEKIPLDQAKTFFAMVEPEFPCEGVKTKCAADAISSREAVLNCNSEILGCLEEYRKFSEVIEDSSRDLFKMPSYPNEASYFQKNWKDEFWGDNYDRLEQAKLQYDPNNIFRCHHCIGSDTNHNFISHGAGSFLNTLIAASVAFVILLNLE